MIQGRYYKKYGHKEVERWEKQRDEQNNVNFTGRVENQESKLFMIHSPITNVSSDVWFVDSACSNHMSGIKLLFEDLDET